MFLSILLQIVCFENTKYSDSPKCFLFRAGALIELSGDTETAFYILWDL